LQAIPFVKLLTRKPSFPLNAFCEKIVAFGRAAVYYWLHAVGSNFGSVAVALAAGKASGATRAATLFNA
jgi:hypothetical protein